MTMKSIALGVILSAVSAASAFAGGYNQAPICEVPEPTTLGLVGLGVVAAVMVARRRRA